MKKFLMVVPVAALFLASCGNGGSNDVEDLGYDEDALDQRLEDKEDFDNAANTFAHGGAKDGKEYFFGVLAEVIEVDVQIQKIRTLDEIDAPEADFNATLDSCLQFCANGRKSLELYKDRTWPKRKELHDLTLEWYDHIEGLVKDHLRALAEPMSRPDETWTEDELNAYGEYLDAREEYLEVDERWVNFQYEYVEANGFQLSDETIDVNALIEQDMAENGE